MPTCMPTRRIRKTGPAVYSVLEAPYESAMLVLLNHFIGRDAGHSAINFLDIATSRDGFHNSGLPAFDSTDYIPLVGGPVACGLMPHVQSVRYCQHWWTLRIHCTVAACKVYTLIYTRVFTHVCAHVCTQACPTTSCPTVTQCGCSLCLWSRSR